MQATGLFIELHFRSLNQCFAGMGCRDPEKLSAQPLPQPASVQDYHTPQCVFAWNIDHGTRNKRPKNTAYPICATHWKIDTSNAAPAGYLPPLLAEKSKSDRKTEILHQKRPKVTAHPSAILLAKLTTNRRINDPRLPHTYPSASLIGKLTTPHAVPAVYSPSQLAGKPKSDRKNQVTVFETC